MSLSPTEPSLGFVITVLALFAFILALSVRPHTVAGKTALFTIGFLALAVTAPYVLAVSGRPLFALAVWIDGAWLAAALACTSMVLLLVALRGGELRSYLYLSGVALAAFSICGTAPLVG